MPPQDAPRIFLGGNLSLPSGVPGAGPWEGRSLGHQESAREAWPDTSVRASFHMPRFWVRFLVKAQTRINECIK